MATNKRPDDYSEQAFDLIDRLMRANLNLYQQKIRMLTFYKSFTMYLESWTAQVESEIIESNKDNLQEVTSTLVFNSDMHHKFITQFRELKFTLFEDQIQKQIEYVKFPNIFVLSEDACMIQMDKVLVLWPLLEYDAELRRNLIGNMIIKNRPSVFSMCCHYCQKLIKSSGLLVNHQLEKHTFKYRCYRCNEYFGFKNGFVSHIQQNQCEHCNPESGLSSETGAYACDWFKCTERFGKVIDLDYHKWQKHIMGNPEIHCRLAECHQFSKLYLCYPIHKEIYRTSQLGGSTAFSRGEADDGSIIPTTNSEEDELFRRLARNYKRTSNNRKTVCGKCGKKFRTQKELDEHKLTHSNKPYRCTWPGCNKTFKNKYYYLKTHSQNHVQKARNLETHKSTRSRSSSPNTSTEQPSMSKDSPQPTSRDSPLSRSGELSLSTSENLVQTLEDPPPTTSEDSLPTTYEDPLSNTSKDLLLNTSEDPLPNTSEDPLPNTSKDSLPNTSKDPPPATFEDSPPITLDDSPPNACEDSLPSNSDDPSQTASEDVQLSKLGDPSSSALCSMEAFPPSTSEGSSLTTSGKVAPSTVEGLSPPQSPESSTSVDSFQSATSEPNSSVEFVEAPSPTESSEPLPATLNQSSLEADVQSQSETPTDH